MIYLMNKDNKQQIVIEQIIAPGQWSARGNHCKRKYPLDQGSFVIKAAHQATEILCYILQKLLEITFWQILIQIDLQYL